MTLTEIGVILFGLFAGYWVVSKLFFRQPKIPVNPDAISQKSIPPKWHEILQVAPSASPAEIRDAYKHLISKYHPDKVDSLGQELKDLAEHKAQEITAAYQEGMRTHGEVP
jgi:DnaJ-domain-containing protein 1